MNHPVLFIWRLIWRIPALLLLLFIGLSYVILTILIRPSLQFTVIGQWSRILLWCFGIQIKRFGEIPPAPYLLVSNHLGWIDIPVLHSLFPVHFIAKAEIRKWPLIGWMALLAGTLFHHRGKKGSAHSMNRVCTKHLQMGEAIAIFPEGKTWHDDQVHVFHGRLLQSAKDAGVEILPVCIRFMCNGQRTVQPAFKENENMLQNLGRLLVGPGLVAEVNIGDLFAANLDRKTLANKAHQWVKEQYTK
ncbi:MAG: lysophospholipid acyltransferase family protein [bacterium]